MSPEPTDPPPAAPAAFRDEPSRDDPLAIGARVRVTQQIAARHYTFAAPVDGTIVEVSRRPTGSWFAHGEADKLWLARVVLRKADGEISTLNFDEHSRVEPLTP